MDVWRVRPSGGSPEQLTDAARGREFPGAARRAHAALCGARGGLVGAVAVGARCRAQGDTPRDLGRRAIHVGVGQPRRPARGRHRRQPQREPVARAAARSAGRRSRRTALPAAGADRSGAGAALRRDVVVLSVRPRDGRRTLEGPGRTGVRSLEERGRGIVRAARGVAGRTAAWPSSSDTRGNGTCRSCRRTARTHRRWRRPSNQGAAGQGTADWSPDGAWIVTGGRDAQGPGLFKIPVEWRCARAARRRSGGQSGLVAERQPDCVCRPVRRRPGRSSLECDRDGTPVELPTVLVRPGGYRFLPDGSGLVYLPRIQSLDFWLLDFATKQPVSSRASAIRAPYGRSTSHLTGNTSCSTARGRTRYRPDRSAEIARHTLPAQVQPDADHRAARIDEGRRLTEVRAEQIVGRQALFRRVVERIEHVHEQLDASRAAEANVLDTRRSSSDCDDSRREPRGSSRMRWSPCGSATCAVAAHGLPLKCCRLAATTKPVRGTSTLPITRNMCGRSFGSRPRALVRSLGSRPNVRLRRGATVLTCAPAAVVPLEACSPDGPRERVRAKRLPAVGPAFFDGHHEAVVGQRVAVGIRQQKAASGRAR